MATPLERYDAIMMEALAVTHAQLSGLKYQNIEQWDSVGHMALIAAIEDGFNLMMDAEDIIDFNSYEKGKEILKKYEIDID